MANLLPIGKRKQIFNLLCEGSGVRSITRTVGCSTNTIRRLQERYFHIACHLNKKHLKDLAIEEIEADELKTFVKAKINTRWVYVALDRRSRMVIHFHIGNRDTIDARKFLVGMSQKLNSGSQISTDCLKSYVAAVEKTPENFAVWSKETSIDVLRARNIGGNLGRTITNRVETHNGNIRQHVIRMGRRTRCWSKQEKFLEQHLILYFFYYNFMKKHKTLKTTPCQEAGIIARQFTFDDLLIYDAMFFDERPTSRSKTYKTKKTRVVNLFSENELNEIRQGVLVTL